ncbi:MAG: helix-turn-helix transcriptional regulator [Tatlockia sp.]|nr:helix-turn-helix transcriptional regulator [Tatlockia sp.]
MSKCDIFIQKSNDVKNILKSLYPLPVNSGIKDLEGRYLDCSPYLIDYVGKNSIKDLQGARDSELCWGENWELYREHDQLVEKKQKTQFFIEPARNAKNELIPLLSIKAPLSLFSSSFSGIIGANISLNQIAYQDILLQLITIGEKLHLNLDSQKMIQITTQAFQFNQAYNQWQHKAKLFEYERVTFSLREAQCLHYFFNHYSAEKTAEKLCISKKTVEFHLAKIKEKLNCQKRSELTNYAIDYGFIDLMFMQFEG